jgi:hypothetical protein
MQANVEKIAAGHTILQVIVVEMFRNAKILPKRVDSNGFISEWGRMAESRFSSAHQDGQGISIFR